MSKQSKSNQKQIKLPIPNSSNGLINADGVPMITGSTGKAPLPGTKARIDVRFLPAEAYLAIHKEPHSYVHTIPMEDQVDVDTFIKAAKEYASVYSICDHKALGNNIIMAGYYDDSLMNLVNKGKPGAEGTFRFVVVAIGSKVVELKVGDEIQVRLGNQQLVDSKNDFLDRDVTSEAYYRMPKEEIEKYTSNYNRVIVRRFFSVPEFDVFAVVK